MSGEEKKLTERVVVNDRGLGKYLEAHDTKGQRFRVQDSSAAMERCVWIFTDQVIGQHNGHDERAALHLNVEGARELISALKSFIDFAEISRRKRR